MSTAEELVERNEENFSRAAITLLKGLVSRGKDEILWQVIVGERAALGDYFKRLGLVLIVDEVDEYAYLQQEENTSLPRLVQRYPLSYPVSMLLVELRKALGQMDTASGDSRLVLTFADIMRRMISANVSTSRVSPEAVSIRPNAFLSSTRSMDTG